MARIVRKLPTPQGIGAGQTATVNCPLGLTYERIYIYLNVDVASVATAVAHGDWGTYLGEIRLMVDGDAKFTMDAADIASMNKFYGQTLKAGVLPIFLARPWMTTPQGQDQTSYGTAAGLSNFTIEIDVKAGVTVNTLELSAQQSPGTPWGPHLAVRKYVVNHGVVGKLEISDIRKAAYSLFALHVASGDIDDVEVIVNTREFLKMSPAIRAAHHEVYERVPQTGFTHIDFAMDRIGEALPMMVQDFRLGLDFTATGNSAVYAEAIEPA
ncbi:major capsid protein P2 [Cognatishimia sp. D5M38]|uniref:Major capsid protein P2 n=1 Tax=Cognatishimia coralii TaxID=3083254 RepID=A0ABU8QCH7_9RHOB